MYTILITHYNEIKRLQLLIEDIHSTLDKYIPEKILIVDDCSDANVDRIGNLYSTSNLPIRILRTDEHKGPYYAAVKGLDNINTDYAVVLHSDSELVGEANPVMYEDCIGYLYKCCKTLDKAGVVTAFGIDVNNYSLISKSNRGIGTNKQPFSIQAMYTYDSLANAWGGLREVASIDSGCYAINMETYNQLGYQEKYAPYKYYLDDFCARCRSIDKHIYLTSYTVYYHLYTYKNKPNGSLAIATEITEEMKDMWVEEWYGDGLWHENSFDRHIFNRQSLSDRFGQFL